MDNRCQITNRLLRRRHVRGRGRGGQRQRRRWQHHVPSVATSYLLDAGQITGGERERSRHAESNMARGFSARRWVKIPHVERVTFYRPRKMPWEPNSPTVKRHLSTVTFQKPRGTTSTKRGQRLGHLLKKTSGPAHLAELAPRGASVGAKADCPPRSVHL
jgi:hypothetical protein